MCYGFESTCTITIEGDTEVGASFDETFAVRINDTQVTGSTVPLAEGIVHVVAAPNPVNRYRSGTLVVLTVEEGETYVFTGWSGKCRGTDVSCTLMVEAETEVVAEFERAYPLFVNDIQVTATTPALPGGGSVIVSPAPNVSGNRFSKGSVVTVTVSQSDGIVFAGWTGDCITPDASCTVVMDQERRVAANISEAYVVTIDEILVTASLHPLSSGTGTVLVQPPPSVHGRGYVSGSVVVLSISPSPLFGFIEWKGDCHGSSKTCMLVANQNREVEVVVKRAYTLFVSGVRVSKETFTLPKGGAFTVDPPPNAPGNRYWEGTYVTAMVMLNENFVFSGWTGACTTRALSCSLSMTQETRTTPEIVPTYRLRINEMPVTGSSHTLPDGSGILNVEPSPTLPNGRYEEGTPVTLSLSPDSVDRLVTWGGDCPPFERSCSVAMNSDKDVRATIAATHRLDINGRQVTGTSHALAHGAGTVFVNPAPEYGHRYRDGTNVELEVTPSPWTSLDHWTGDCAEYAVTCLLVMDQDRSIEIDLHIGYYYLRINGETITAAPLALDEGMVIANPPPNAAGGRYIEGTLVTVSYIPNDSYGFKEWSGGCSGLTHSCNVRMTDHVDLVLEFSSK